MSDNGVVRPVGGDRRGAVFLPGTVFNSMLPPRQQ